MTPPRPRTLPSFTCPVCGMTSYNPNDLRYGYCGNCHAFTGDSASPMYNPDLSGYHRTVTPFSNDATPPFTNDADPTPLSGEVLSAPHPAAAEHTAAGRPLYWHVFGAPLAGTKGGAKNFPMITAGPVTRSADAEVKKTTVEGSDGVTTFRYMGTFDHDPSDAELRGLRPRSYR